MSAPAHNEKAIASLVASCAVVILLTAFTFSIKHANPANSMASNLAVLPQTGTGMVALFVGIAAFALLAFTKGAQSKSADDYAIMQ
mmetsp:Transcript_118031/g.270742  ORF Transcript_118031/g.270742 Transcript_118031/m.270742 type:complete len:86 (+) Transcript_118031:61-318(+)